MTKADFDMFYCPSFYFIKYVKHFIIHVLSFSYIKIVCVRLCIACRSNTKRKQYKNESDKTVAALFENEKKKKLKRRSSGELMNCLCAPYTVMLYIIQTFREQPLFCANIEYHIHMQRQIDCDQTISFRFYDTTSKPLDA